MPFHITGGNPFRAAHWYCIKHTSFEPLTDRLCLSLNAYPLSEAEALTYVARGMVRFGVLNSRRFEGQVKDP